MAGDEVALNVNDSDEIKDTDIVFDCPHCGKSLAIDYRGAGLTIPCSDCGKSVQVPIPEGMEIADIDSTGEQQEILIMNLRRSLTAAEHRIGKLESELEELNDRRAALEKSRTQNLSNMNLITERLEAIENSASAILECVQDMKTK